MNEFFRAAAPPTKRLSSTLVLPGRLFICHRKYAGGDPPRASKPWDRPSPSLCRAGTTKLGNQQVNAINLKCKLTCFRNYLSTNHEKNFFLRLICCCRHFDDRCTGTKKLRRNQGWYQHSEFDFRGLAAKPSQQRIYLASRAGFCNFLRDIYHENIFGDAVPRIFFTRWEEKRIPGIFHTG